MNKRCLLYILIIISTNLYSETLNLWSTQVSAYFLDDSDDFPNYSHDSTGTLTIKIDGESIKKSNSSYYVTPYDFNFSFFKYFYSLKCHLSVDVRKQTIFSYRDYEVKYRYRRNNDAWTEWKEFEVQTRDIYNGGTNVATQNIFIPFANNYDPNRNKIEFEFNYIVEKDSNNRKDEEKTNSFIIYTDTLTPSIDSNLKRDTSYEPTSRIYDKSQDVIFFKPGENPERTEDDLNVKFIKSEITDDTIISDRSLIFSNLNHNNYSDWVVKGNTIFYNQLNTIFIKQRAMDIMGNTTYSNNTISLIADNSKPIIEKLPNIYDDAGENLNKLNTTFQYNIYDYDTGSGLKANSASITFFYLDPGKDEYKRFLGSDDSPDPDPDPDGATITKEDTEGDLFQFTVNNFFRDTKYKIRLDAEDNVTNTNSDESYFGLTLGPQFELNLDEIELYEGNQKFPIKASFGEFFGDNEIGYKSYDIFWGTENLLSLSESDIKTIYDNKDSLTEGVNPVAYLKELTVEIPFKKENAHKTANLFIQAGYNDNYTEESLPFALPLPNTTFNDDNNDFSLTFYRDGYEIENYTFASDRSDTEQLFYIDNFQLLLNGAGGRNGLDAEDDVLFLRIINDNGFIDIPANEGLISFDSETNQISTAGGTSPESFDITTIRDIKIIETYREFDLQGIPGELISTEFPLNLSISKDTDFQQELIGITIDDADKINHEWNGILCTNDGTIDWNICYGTDNQEFHDLSGIQEVTFFEYDYRPESFTLEDFRNLSSELKATRTFEVGEVYQIDPEESLFHLSHQDENTSSLRKIGVYIQDFAGHYLIKTREVYYDLSSPLPLEPNGGTVSWFASEESAENLWYYDFDRSENIITLKYNLNQELYADLEDCYVTASCSAPYSIAEIPPEGYRMSSGSDFLKIAIPEDFSSDSPIDLVVTFTDYAGNITENFLTVYTPLYFTESDPEYYISETENEWDNQGDTPLGHYLAWDQINLMENELVLYDQESRVVTSSIDSIGDFVHTNLDAHDERTYLLHGKNRSGYESEYSTTQSELKWTELSFTRRLENNSPVVTFYEEIGTYTDPADGKYLGPLNTIIVHFEDYDETDDFVIRYFVNDEFYNEVEVSGTLSESGLEHVIAVKNFFSDFEDSQSYEIRYEILDYWGADEAREEGTIVLNPPERYTFDSVNPDLSQFSYDQREGYAYIYGNIHLNITEEGSGLYSRVLYENSDGELNDLTNGILLTDGDDLESYSHLISQIPDIQDYTLYLRMEDQVGNFQIESIGPFSKDAVDPVLINAGIDKEEHIFSRPSIPVDLSWTDNLSGVSRMLYQFSDSTGVIKEGSVSSDGNLLGETSSDWSLFCSLSETFLSHDDLMLKVKILDNAGNGEGAEWTELAQDIRIDTSSPAVSITGQEGFRYNQGRYYVSGNSTFELDIDITDDNPSGDIWYALESENKQTESSSLQTLLGSLSDGTSYSLWVYTKDLAGNIGFSSPLVFTADSSAADTDSYSLSISNYEAFVQGQQIRFTFSALDEHTGIETLHLWIGREEEGILVPAISRLLPGHLSDGTVDFDFAEGRTYCLNLPDVEEGHYFFRAATSDYAGNRSEYSILSGQTIQVVQSDETLVVQDFGLYSNNPYSLSAWWNYEGQKEFNHYAYRVLEAGTGSAVSEWHYTFDSYGSVDFPEGLAPGTIYYFEVYAGFGDGSSSTHRYSPGTLIDTAAPEITNITIPEYGTLSALNVGWNAFDELSQIDQVLVKLESYQYDDSGNILTESYLQDGMEVTVPLRNELGVYPVGKGALGENIHVLKAEEVLSLGIPDGRKIFVTLVVSDLAGNVCEKNGGIFVKDSSAPPVPVVLDGGDFINPEKDILYFDWLWSSQDPHSGNARYYYQILNNSEELSVEWTEIAGSRFVLDTTAGNFENGSQITLAVKAENGAGLTTIGYSDGIILDSTKPARAVVSLLDSLDQEATYLLGRNGKLRIESYDDESGIESYYYQAGTYSGTQWIPLQEELTEVDPGMLDSNVIVPEELESPGTIYYKAYARNTAGEFSLPGYTSGAKIFDDTPLVSNLIGESKNGEVIFSWEVENLVPLEQITLTLRKSGALLSSVNVEGHRRSYTYSGLDDGIYTLQMDYRAVNAATSGKTALSPSISLDTTPPEIQDLDYTKFVNDIFNYGFSIQDNLTGSSRYRYRMGPTGSPDLLTQGWLWQDSTGSRQEETVSFLNDFPGGYDCLIDGGIILFSCQTQDLAGNWSDIYSSQPILVDRTAPGTPFVEMDRVIEVGETLYTQEKNYITKSDRVENILLEGRDNESGINGFRWAVREKGSLDPVDWQEIIPYTPDGSELTISLSQIVMTGLILEDKKEYELFVQLRNGSGILSESGILSSLNTDFSAPVFATDLITSGLDSEPSENGTGLIYNTSGDVNLHILEEESEVLRVEYCLIDPTSTEGNSVVQYYLGKENTDLVVPFLPADPGLFGNYTLRIALSDAGGYESVLYQDIRLNAPPDFALQDVTSNPMKPFDLDLSDWISDQDEVRNVSVSIEHGGIIETWDLPFVEDLKSLAFDHDVQFAGETEFTYSVSAEDRFGQSSSSKGLVKIVNTSQGTLFTSEYWTGEHQILGTVIVPEGTGLYLADGTEVEVLTGEERRDIRLEIREGAILDHLGQAEYKLFDPALGIPWMGLYVKGVGDLSNISVSGAERGVTLANGLQPIISGSEFWDNDIGLHLVGSSPEVSNCLFADNRFYGVKEDEESHPLMIENDFSGNGFDYYDLDITVMTADEINSIEGNNGNRGDN